MIVFKKGGNMATISLCMISLDEEHCIGKGIENCLEYVDEIVILDGFSADRTQEIALSYPKVKWYEMEWNNDFGGTKNLCMEKATCEWVLWKDCDETFEPDVLNNLQRLTLFEPYIQYDAFAFARKTYVDGLLVNLADHDYQVRYWKLGKDIHYEGKLHEGVTGFENMMKLNVWIIHDKTTQMQQEDNERYWDMGQTPPAGWVKIKGKWTYSTAYVNGIPVEALDGISIDN